MKGDKSDTNITIREFNKFKCWKDIKLHLSNIHYNTPKINKSIFLRIYNLNITKSNLLSVALKPKKKKKKKKKKKNS